MKMNKKALILLSVGHLVTDLNQGALPALLPFFKEALSLSYTLAGAIIMVMNLTSSVIQPAFGYLSDRRSLRWFLPVAPLAACLGISLSGLMPSYYLLLTCVVFSGIGTASFHPEGFKTAYFFTGEKKATGMSIFSVGGNLGIALGPLCSIGLVTFFGLRGTLGLILPGVGMTVIFCLSMSWLTSPLRSGSGGRPLPTKYFPSRDVVTTLVFLVLTVIVRSWIQVGLVAFIPFYYIDYLKGDPLYAAKLVSTFLLAGAVGTLVGAPFADRWGYKKFLAIAMLLIFPMLVLFLISGGSLLFILIAITGMTLVSTFTVTMVMGQTLLPQYLGMVSGLMVGFAVGTGGIGVTLLGIIADHWGVPTAMKSILVLPLLGFILSLLIKYPPNKDDEKG